MTSTQAQAAFRRARNVFTPARRAFIFYALLSVFAAMGMFRAIKQYRESKFVSQFARDVRTRADSKDTLATVIALRDYLRQNVRRENFPGKGRPFLRNTAAETLRSGKGRCGESTRAFINMADSLGIRSQRLYLAGKRRHVVALLILEDGRQLIVDSSDRPYFKDLESLNQLSNHPEFNSYSSFNESRSLIPLPSKTVNLGRFAVYLENPHVLMAAFWFALAAGLVGLNLLRRPLSVFLARRKRAVRAPRNDWNARAAPSEVL